MVRLTKPPSITTPNSPPMKDKEQEQPFQESSVHLWFSLSYAQYLTIPRSIMEAMPHEWQERMVKCLEELDETFKWRPSSGRYWVQLKNDKGQYVKDPLMQYRHPDLNYINSIREIIKPNSNSNE